MTKTEFNKTLVEFVENMYGQQDSMSLEEIIKLKKGVRDDVYDFEVPAVDQFHSFKLTEKGSITVEDFAKCLISYCHPQHRSSYFKAIESKPLPDGEVSIEEFKAFKEFVSDDLETFNNIIKDMGIISEKKFERVFKQLSQDNFYKLSPLQHKVMFHILDINQDGRVTYEEFNHLLSNANKLGRSIEKGVDWSDAGSGRELGSSEGPGKGVLGDGRQSRQNNKNPKRVIVSALGIIISSNL